VVSIGAGYMAPLPYNYLRLRKYGRSCHWFPMYLVCSPPWNIVIV
jgi:hypothetical protein